MVKTIREFVDEMKMLRREMYKKSDKADLKLVASWLDKMVISLEKLGPTLELMNAGLEQIAEQEVMVKEPGKRKTAKRKKKTKKKTVKKTAKRRTAGKKTKKKTVKKRAARKKTRKRKK